MKPYILLGAAILQIGLVKPQMVERPPEVNYVEEKQFKKLEPLAKLELPSKRNLTVSKPSNNEDAVWDWLIGKGFSRNQTAGIMGNLRQEHNFQTSGDGIAQWIGGRKTRLMALPNPYSLNTQLNFMLSELNGSESKAGDAVRASTTVEQATIAFQNLYERCNPRYCMQSKRIQFAYDILGRH